MTRELQSTLDTSGILPPAMRNHIPCMAHIIQLILGAFMSSLGVKGRTNSWEAHEGDQLFGENESTGIGKSQWLWKEGNAGINKVLAMRPGLAKIIDKVHISRHCEWPETNIHKAENACVIDYADSWSSKRVNWLLKSQSTNCSTTCYGCENTVELDSGVASASQPISRIHPRVASTFKIQHIAATAHNTGWIAHGQVHHECFEAIPVLDPVDVKKVYGCYTSYHHYLQWHVRSHGWCYVSFGYEEDTMEGWLILCCEGSAPQSVQILCRSHSNSRAASHLTAYPWLFPEVAIISAVGQGEGYESRGWDILYYAIRGGPSEVCRVLILHQTSTNVRH